jgi:hypothetical protein
MGGTLKGFSDGPGTGSRFTLQIPLAAASDLERIISGRKAS